MKVEQRGVPPYTVLSADLATEKGRSAGHSCSAANFTKAIEIVFSLTDGGLSLGDPKWVIESERIVDSNGDVVFSAGNQNDLALLKQIDESQGGLDGLETIPPGS